MLRSVNVFIGLSTGMLALVLVALLALTMCVSERIARPMQARASPCTYSFACARNYLLMMSMVIMGAREQ